MKIYVTYEESQHDGRSWSDREVTVYEFKAMMATDFEPVETGPYWDGCEFHGSPNGYASVVIARYSDGDSFNSSSGRGQILAAYANHADAVASAKQVKETKSCKHLGVNQYWGGWCSELEDVDITIVPLYLTPKPNEP